MKEKFDEDVVVMPYQSERFASSYQYNPSN